MIDNTEKQESNNIEERTLENLLKDLRTKTTWNYINVVEELNKKGITTNEKQIKKWEIGLEFPDLNTIYKLSEIYFVPSENFIIARNNSHTKEYNSIHITIIKWFCYLTGFTLKVGYIFFYFTIVAALIISLLYFCEKAYSV